jgi:RNA ligase
MNRELLNEMIEKKYINVTKHPKEELYIYNYSQKAQFEYIWNEVTINCRGLIADKDFNILARPFGKFFNLEELENKGKEIPKENFEVYEKLDGSLGILYWIGDYPFISTRGSFNSDQAIKGSKILYNKYSDVFDKLDKSKTYLFEIIYPENRIVVDYGDKEELILLGIIDTKTGKNFPLEDIGFPIAKRFDGIKDFKKLKELEEDNKEGFVIKFDSGFRMKLKFEEYKRLHRILTNVSNKAIWELLKDGGDFNEILDKVPDEFFDWVVKTKSELLQNYRWIEEQCKKDFKILETQKETALYFKTKKYPSILFKMMQKRDYSEMIWKRIRPVYSKPFKVEEGASSISNQKEVNKK